MLPYLKNPPLSDSSRAPNTDELEYNSTKTFHTIFKEASAGKQTVKFSTTELKYQETYGQILKDILDLEFGLCLSDSDLTVELTHLLFTYNCECNDKG